LYYPGVEAGQTFGADTFSNQEATVWRDGVIIRDESFSHMECSEEFTRIKIMLGNAIVFVRKRDEGRSGAGVEFEVLHIGPTKIKNVRECELPTIGRDGSYLHH